MRALRADVFAKRNAPDRVQGAALRTLFSNQNFTWNNLLYLKAPNLEFSRFHKWIHTCGFNLFNLFFRGWRLFQTTWSPPAGSATPYDTSITFIAFNTPSAWMVTGVSLVVSINNHTSEKRALKLHTMQPRFTEPILFYEIILKWFILGPRTLNATEIN